MFIDSTGVFKNTEAVGVEFSNTGFKANSKARRHDLTLIGHQVTNTRSSYSMHNFSSADWLGPAKDVRKTSNIITGS